MKKQFSKIFFILFTSVILLSSCSSDSSSSSGESNALFNKWWYDVDNYAADLYFNSNGNYQQHLTFGTTVYDGAGNWVWTNESQKIAKVTYTQGVNAVSEFWVKFVDIQDHQIKIKQSLNGTDFTDVIYTFSDQDN